MGFTSVLKKIGEDAVKAVNVVATIEGYEPEIKMAEALLPHGAQSAANKFDVALSDVEQIAKQIEVLAPTSGLSGAQKLNAASALLTQLIVKSIHLDGKDIGDNALVQQGIREIMQGVVDIKNGVKA